MQGEEEVELTIQTNIPSLGGSTRSVVDAENITSITALAFDSDHELIKVANATLNRTNIENGNSTTGTMTIKVPVRTRRIHFIAKNGDAEFTEITNDDYGKSDEYLLKDRLATELHYWGKLDFDDAEDLRNNVDGDDNVTLYRNMAKLTLQLPNGTSGYIAGFLNYNTDGTIAAYSGDDFNYHTEKTSTHYLPATHTDSDEDDKYKNAQTKPIVQYLFEEENANGDYVYAICKIADLYYKIAFAYADSNGDPVYFPIVRNHSYTINIMDVSKITSYGEGYFKDAIDAAPINATAQEEVDFIFDYETIIMFIEDKTCEIFVTIPEGITKLKVLPPEEVFTIKSVSSELDSELDLGNDGLYTVTPGTKYTITLELNENHTETGRASVYFQGYGVGMIAHNDVEVKLRNKEKITITPSERTVINTQGSNCYFDVNIPLNIDNLVIEAGEAFTVTSVATLSSTPVSPNDDGSYSVTNTTYRVTLTLKDDAVGKTGEFPIHFAGTSEYWGAEGTATITLQDPDLDVYEIWVNNGTWEASDEYSVEFFGYEGTFVTGGQVLGNNFYDALAVNETTYSADNHKQQAMVMGQDNSISFTIGATRYLTLLVANDGDDSDTPSIQLSNGSSWTTGGDTEDLTNGTYNFAAEGEITSAGRLIRYELPAGTYTLQRGNNDDNDDNNDYLLYYMRVSTTKPTMTDIVTDATASNYTLAWSGGEWGNYTKINDNTYFVDDDATTFTPTLTYKGLTRVKLAASSSLNITTGNYSFSDNQGDGTTITYTEVTSNNNGSDNGDIAIKATVIDNESIIYNAGTYALSGIANVTDTDYKYAAFYDVLRLNTVGFTVKNTIKLGLYYSWNGDAKTITEYVDGLPYIIGFRMPNSLPVAINAENDTSTPINFTIDNNWIRRESGLGVIYNNAPDYQLDVQQEGNSSNKRVHPRPRWTYKIEWNEVAASTIQPTTEDADIYFSYGKDNITQEPEIATTKSDSEKLALTLDFSSNSENESTHTLNFGNDFYLRATISAEDANKYAGAHVRLQGVFSNNTQGGGNSAIHWTNSRKDGSIEYARNSSDGTQLQFEIKAGQTTYEIHWQFVRDDGSTTTPTQFTYTVDNDAYNITNDSESATIVLNGNGQVVDNPLSIELDFYAAKNGDQNFDYGNSFTDLLLNTSHVYLKAKISSEDAAKYDGKQVILTGTYPSQNAEIGGLAIHWVDSKKSGNNNDNIWYTNNTGESLQFNVHSGILEYLIEWVFVTGQHYKGGDIGFTYNISNYAISDVDGTFNNFAGDTSATIAFTNEPIYLDVYSDADTDAGNDISIVSGSQLVMKATLSSDIALGTQITFDLSNSTGDGIYSITWNENNSASSAKMDWPNITLEVVQGQSDYYLYWYPTVSDERSATLNFTVSGNYNLNSVGNTSYSKTVTVSRTVIDDEDFSNFKNVGPGSVSVEDGKLCLTNNTDCQNAWDAQAMYETNGIEYGETYTLTFKAKIANNTTQGAMAVAIQRFENGECVATDHYRIFNIDDINNAKKENQDWAEFTYDITIQDNDQETPNENKPTHFMFNFGDLVGTLNIYDLTLVKN